MSSCIFINQTATTKISTLSLHDALPISDHVRAQRPFVGLDSDCVVPGGDVDHGRNVRAPAGGDHLERVLRGGGGSREERDRKSTRLNSSHANISYAVFCLKKKKTI